ncbi:hypothetical protein DV515_00012372 [Chloebia gouldiae]|uniref:Uncharacterized protein n=1 Tax=Chloebia gouldiae TaxID=44316 RepID=A0A3L8S521_CHLGU|nr:hypothetical protein DV515_00012372 [Chloebia gouldiae]
MCQTGTLRIHNFTVLPSHNSTFVNTNDSAYSNFSATVDIIEGMVNKGIYVTEKKGVTFLFFGSYRNSCISNPEACGPEGVTFSFFWKTQDQQAKLLPASGGRVISSGFKICSNEGEGSVEFYTRGNAMMKWKASFSPPAPAALVLLSLGRALRPERRGLRARPAALGREFTELRRARFRGSRRASCQGAGFPGGASGGVPRPALSPARGSAAPGASWGWSGPSARRPYWTHVLFTWRSREGLKVYVNGSLSTADPHGKVFYDYGDAGAELLGGTEGAAARRSVSGAFDEFVIWERALSPREVRQYFTAAVGEWCPPWVSGARRG